MSTRDSILLVLLSLVFAVGGSATSMKITLTPWCENSMRVRIEPTTLPSAVQASAAALKALFVTLTEPRTYPDPTLTEP